MTELSLSGSLGLGKSSRNDLRFHVGASYYSSQLFEAYSKSANQNIGGEETQGAMTPKPESAGMEDSRGTCTL